MPKEQQYKANGKLSAKWYSKHGGKVGDIVDYTHNKSGQYRMLKQRKNGAFYFGTVPNIPPRMRKASPHTAVKSPVRQRILSPSQFDKMQVMRYKELRPRQIENNPTLLNQYVGWYASEKIDGWQGIWDGVDTLYTKSYKKSFNIPTWWLELLQRSGVPPMTGEIIRKGSTNSAEQAALASKTNTAAWGTPENPLAFFHVFDIVSKSQRYLPFEQRIPLIQSAVATACGSEPKCPIKVAKQTKIVSGQNVFRMWKRILRKGGEGLVLTSPTSLYGNFKTKKSSDRVKLKGRNDDEAIVIGYNLGYKKNPQWIQSLRVRYHNKKMNLGIGLTEREREKYTIAYPLNSVVTFSYRLLSANKKPLESRIVGRRDKSTLASSHWIRCEQK